MAPRKCCFARSSLAMLFALSCSVRSFAQPGKDQDPLSWDRNVSGLFSRNCNRCHGQDDPSGDIDLASDTDVGRIVAKRDKWLRALSMLKSKQMPPEDERQPSDEQRELMLQFLDTTLNSIDCSSVTDPGKPVLRRLIRTEYDNCILDLTGLDLKLAQDFPPESLGYGFDNVADTLSLTPALVDMYHSAAKKVVQAVLASEDSAWKVRIADATSRQETRELVHHFASEAFRRPADDYYVNRLMRIYDKSLAQGDTAGEATGHALTAVLMSPYFLMRIEEEQPDQTEAYRVSEYELASRLSFFLWSRGPDKELLKLAEEQRLSEPEVLDAQVSRMLADPRSIALANNFFAQWLNLREVATHSPDPQVFPEFDEALRQSMMTETRMFLSEVIQQDRSVKWLFDADFGYIDARLADHYDLSLPAQVGNEFVRTAFPDRKRGGLLTSAAFLMTLSDPARTNIPRRGNFIAGQLLGEAPPPPPPGVPPLEASDDGQSRSLRENFELHRSASECKNCHAKIDPLGFSLENYDAIGRYRTSDRNLPIDSTAEIDAFVFEGAVGLKDYLASRQDEIVKLLATKLTIYALGRGLQLSDECVVNDMLDSANANDHRFSSLVKPLVTSLPFTHRRN
jgi:hypothetical protein